MSYENPRLKLEMSVMDIVAAFSEGNPGALRVVMELLTHTKYIDTQDAFQGLGAIMGLDNLDCYGSKIWVFYKDVCEEDLSMMLVLLRAVQLGMLSESELKLAIDQSYSHTLDKEALKKQVLDRLEGFRYGNIIPNPSMQI